MSNIKGKIGTGLAIIAGIALLVGTFIYFENYEAVYYTKIDNTKIEKNDISSEMQYTYTLECYNEFGQKKEYSFKTYKELREDAYLKLEIRSAGVHTWEEIDETSLPEKVKEKYE